MTKEQWLALGLEADMFEKEPWSSFRVRQLTAGYHMVQACSASSFRSWLLVGYYKTEAEANQVALTLKLAL